MMVLQLDARNISSQGDTFLRRLVRRCKRFSKIFPTIISQYRRHYLALAKDLILASFFRGFEGFKKWCNDYEYELYSDRANQVMAISEMPTRRLCIFAIYEPDGLLATTLKLLDHLRDELGFSICLVSNARINLGELDEIQKRCFKIIERKNVGLDFGAYKDALLNCINDPEVNYQNLERVLIANDSMVLLRPLQDVFVELDSSACDFWGLAEHGFPKNVLSFRGEINCIASFFICFKPQVFNSAPFKKFWHDLKYFSSKRLIVQKAELGLSHILEESGFRGDAYLNANRLWNILRNCDLEALKNEVNDSRPSIENPTFRKTTYASCFLADWFHVGIDSQPYFLLRYLPRLPYLKKWAFYGLSAKSELIFSELKKRESEGKFIVSSEDIAREMHCYHAEAFKKSLNMDECKS